MNRTERGPRTYESLIGSRAPESLADVRAISPDMYDALIDGAFAGAFGRLDNPDVQAPVQTFGTGARGFNVYDGVLEHANFESIVTDGDGATGVQVSKPLPVLEIKGDLATEGGEGLSLVKGVQMKLQAVGLSVKPGGSIGKVSIGGQLRTSGAKVVTLEVEDREIDQIDVAGGISATGAGSDAVHLSHGEIGGLDHTTISSAAGEQLVRA